MAGSFGAFFILEARYASAAEFRAFKEQIEYEQKTGQLERIDDRIFTIKQRHKDSVMPLTVEEEVQKLNGRKRRLDERLKALEGGQ